MTPDADDVNENVYLGITDHDDPSLSNMASLKVDIKAGWLFPFHFLILGGVFLLAGFIVVVDHPVMASVLGFIAFFILTAFEGTEVNPTSKTFREYYSFLFFKTGKLKKYRSVEGIFIHKARVSQRIFTPRTMSSSNFTHIEYHAYLKLNESEKIFLISHKDKRKLMQKSRKIAQALNTSVADHAVFP